MNNTTKILVNHFSKNPGLVELPYDMKDLVNRLILDHSNHLLVMALAASALESVNWSVIEETIESIKSRD